MVKGPLAKTEELLWTGNQGKLLLTRRAVPRDNRAAMFLAASFFSATFRYFIGASLALNADLNLFTVSNSKGRIINIHKISTNIKLFRNKCDYFEKDRHSMK